MKLLLLLLLGCLWVVSPGDAAAAAAKANITRILASHPSCAAFSAAAAKYGVDKQINSRSTLTVLCPPNSALDALTSSLSPQSIYDVLCFHVLLDYFDLAKLRTIANGTTTTTTLYQTTGLATGNQGALNITDEAGAAHVGLSQPGSPLTAVIQTQLYDDPYNICVMTVSHLLLPAGVGAPEPSPAPVNLTLIIAQSKQYTTFLKYLESTGVDAVLQKHDIPPGLTLFCPTDAAFSSLPKGFLSNLSNVQLVSLLEFHAMQGYYPTQELVTLSGPQSTLASGSGGGTFQYTSVSPNKAGTPVIDTGYNKVAVGATLYATDPVAVYGISSVLIPTDIAGLAPSSAPSPAPASSPTPVPSASPVPSSSPSPSPSASVPNASPPAPPTETPGASSAQSPTGSQASKASPIYIVLGAVTAALGGLAAAF